MKRLSRLALPAVLLIGLSGCMGPQLKMAPPEQIAAPDPIPDNSGKYMNPYTEDGVLAAWVDKAVNAKMGAQAGSMIGQYAGQKAMENVPFVGGLLGQKLGAEMGRKIALESSGGEEFIKDTSDSSFNDIKSMSLYLYARHSTHKHYQQALDATMAIYPELQQGYGQALWQASREIAQNGAGSNTTATPAAQQQAKTGLFGF